jgi:hypothetical protein
MRAFQGEKGKISCVKPLILKEGNPLKHQHFNLKTFMQGLDEESLEKIAVTST